ESVVIIKDRLRFLEGHAMLPQVDPRLRGVPFDADRHHTSMYVRCMFCARWEWRGQRIALKLRATRPPAQEYWTNSPCPPGHNAPLPLRRSPPASFKRLLGCPPHGPADQPSPGRDRDAAHEKS